jgi:hypothetical protein
MRLIIASAAILIATLASCKQERLPLISEVTARMYEPIPRDCRDVVPVAITAVKSHGSRVAGPVATSNADDEVNIVGGWSYPDPEPYGFRLVATLSRVDGGQCRVRVRAESRAYPHSSLLVVPQPSTQIEILRAFDPKKADEISTMLQKYSL